MGCNGGDLRAREAVGKGILGLNIEYVKTLSLPADIDVMLETMDSFFGRRQIRDIECSQIENRQRESNQQKR